MALLGNKEPFINGIKNLPAILGTVYYVDPDNAHASDGNLGTDPRYPFLTIAAAYSACTSNKDDVIALSAYSAHTVTEMLDITKNRVHFISLGGRENCYGMGASTRIVMGVTTAATDIAVMKNTGIRNTFTGIKFDSSNTVAESLYVVAEGGEYAIYQGCEFYKSTDLDETGAAEVLNNGDSPQFINCVIGSTANIVADNCIRANMLLTATLSGKKCRDTILKDCIFYTKAGGTEHVDIYGANATDVERAFIVRDTLFYNNILAAADPAHAVGFGAAQTQGNVWLHNCGEDNHTVMSQAGMNIAVTGAVPTFATTGVSVKS